MLKYKIYVLFLFLIGLFSFKEIYAYYQVLPLFNKVIYIDVGHGGKDPGALYNGILEKNINLEIAKKLEKSLERQGAIVYLTRYGDYDLSVNYTNNHKRSDLSRRSNIINKSKCDMFLSIHLNAEETGLYRGIQVFYTDSNKKNLEIANLFQEEFKNNLMGFRNVKRNNALYMLKRIKRPGVLIEVGFLSNAHDRYLLKSPSYQLKTVNVITNTIVKYFKTH